jgi:peptidoglycan/LPS O-acetylase OafA/YrhL
MIETVHEPRQRTTPGAGEPDRRSLVTRYSLLVTALCGFVAVFGIAHLLLVHITKPSGYVFFGTLATVSLLIAGLLYAFARDRRAMLVRFGFGALMCACAVPFIYLARFAPESARPTVRNLLGLPFFVLALVGPGPFRRSRRNRGA